MRDGCVVCGRPTLHQPPEQKDYPTEITADVLAKNANVTDDEIAGDILDTEREIGVLRAEIGPREKFAEFLKLLQTARAS